ncbi:hypothetical protein M8J76_005796 [Diaphorina citri]|nr:hypothetical protein M8J75_001931 [Diaphorina citri]KAI5726634.1 hypothetical protein M8J76_005796 [Diaphorina citri]
MVQAKPVNSKTLNKNLGKGKLKPIIPVALMLLEDKKKTKPVKSLSKKSATKLSNAISSKLGDTLNFCIMKTNKIEKVSKKKDETLKSTVATPTKFKPKKEKSEKPKLKTEKPVPSVTKFSKKVSKQNNNQTNVGKNKTKPDNCLPVAKVPKTKKLTQPKKKPAESKNNKEPAFAVHNSVNKKPEPKKPSQSKKQSKNITVNVNKKLKPVHKTSTKGNNANVNNVVIVKKLEKPSKSNIKNMAVPKLLSLNEAKPKAASPKKKDKTPKKVKSDKTEQNNNVDSAKPKTQRKPKAEKQDVPKKTKKEKGDVKKTEKSKVDDKDKLALVPVKRGRGRKKSVPDLEPNDNNQIVLHTGRKIVECKKKVIMNRPKKQRVASLNALAKVHCLYENDVNCIKTTSTSINRVNSVNSETAIIVSRSHRSAPGLRSIGHHWEMLDSSSASSSSSDESSHHEMMDHHIEERKEEKIEIVQPTAVTIKELDTSASNDEEPKPKAKRRKRATEIKMDLKDMVVRKRMASLNASAILAASYSSEKRTVIVKTQEGVMKQKETKKKQRKEKEEEDEEECTELVLGKRKSKKNKLSVIVEHQDTDVTITVNRSTRSTHERVCSINGMHYCISSTTSHTQTEATTLATEAVLHADNQPPPLPQLTDSSTPCNSYTPLSALSSMTPPGIVSTESVQRPPYTSSAFTAPPGLQSYRHHDYYQPAGPLISQAPLPSQPKSHHSLEPRPPPPVPPTEPVYHHPPPQPPTTMYSPYPPYDTPLHSTYHHSQYPPYYQPQPLPYSTPRYYLNPKDVGHPAPSNYYPNYIPPPPPSHSYYQGPSPPSLYMYPPAPTYSHNASPSSCYSHPQTVNSRLGTIDSSYQNCPCPMQSCPKNVHIGPLTVNGKGFSKPAQSQAPLPPVMLALSLELSGNLGPPSPARGSTGMPPPPSPALITARNPDNGLLTTSKLISESMQVTNDDKMKLSVPKCESSGNSAGTEFHKEVTDVKQSRKRKQHPIMDRSALKKVAVTSPLRDENCLPAVDTLKSETQRPVIPTSQLLLKPVHGKLNGECTGNSVKKALPQDFTRLETKHNNILTSHTNEIERPELLKTHKPKNNLKQKKSLENKEERQQSTSLPSNTVEKGKITSSLNSTQPLSLETKKCNATSLVNDKGEAKKQKARNSSPSKPQQQLQLIKKHYKASPVESSKLSPNSWAIKNLKWSNGWSWEGTPYEASVFLSSDEHPVVRNCYPAMRHIQGDIIQPRDCILLKSGTRKKDLPFIAKVGALWENPEDGEMMVSLLWYYRPEHTEQGTSYRDNKDEIFASRHRDINSVACIEDKCYVLTYREYCRYRKKMRSIEDNVVNFKIIVPPLGEGQYERLLRQPPGQVSPDRVFYCHKVYDFRTKRLLKNPC